MTPHYLGKALHKPQANIYASFGFLLPPPSPPPSNYKSNFDGSYQLRPADIHGHTNCRDRDKGRASGRGRRPVTASPPLPTPHTCPRLRAGAAPQGGQQQPSPPATLFGSRQLPGRPRRHPGKPKSPHPGGSGAEGAASPRRRRWRWREKAAPSAPPPPTLRRGLPSPCPALPTGPGPTHPAASRPALPSAPAASGFLQRRWGGGAAQAPPRRPAAPGRPQALFSVGGGRRRVEVRSGGSRLTGTGHRRLPLCGDEGAAAAPEARGDRETSGKHRKTAVGCSFKNGHSRVIFSWREVQKGARAGAGEISAAIFILLRNRFSGGSVSPLPA